MDILDYLRPRWRRSDPEVRAAAVREMGADDQARLETIARNDPNARVRRIAIKKLQDPEQLEALAQGETDEDLRAFAFERAREIRTTAVPRGVAYASRRGRFWPRARASGSRWAGRKDAHGSSSSASRSRA